MRALRALLIVAAGVWTLACGDAASPEPARPGTLTLSVTRPVGNDVALLLQLIGPGLAEASVEPAAGWLVFARPAPGGLRVAAFGPPISGAILRVNVAGLENVERYRADLLETADTSNAVRPAVTGYSFRWTAGQ